MKHPNKIKPKTSASYPGNLGLAEMVQFYQLADNAQQELMEGLLDRGRFQAAWSLLQKVLGLKLHRMETTMTRNAAVTRLASRWLQARL